MASWQSLARKTAHELKNSLTPIRLTVEEMLARHPPADRAFMDQAVQIVVSEIDALERRVRAFSEFASEPPVKPEVPRRQCARHRAGVAAPPRPSGDGLPTSGSMRAGRACYADADLVKGILTNLLQNAAEAAGAGGSVLRRDTRADGEQPS